MLFAAAGQGACMAILAGTVWDGTHTSGLVATVMLFLFNFFFAVGLLAIPWLRKFPSPHSFFRLGMSLTRLPCSACRVCSPGYSNKGGRPGYCHQLYASRYCDSDSRLILHSRDLYILGRRDHSSQHPQHRLQNLHLLRQYAAIVSF